MSDIATGIVKENWNEDFPGRVRVEYSLGEPGKMLTGWIPVMTGYAGPGYGTYLLPEIGTEVVVAFNHGDKDCPIVIGCLWNKVNTLPEKAATEKNNKKLWKTKGGYQLSLEEGEEEKLLFTDSKAENSVSISSKDKIISIDAKEKLEIKIGGETFLTIEKGKITIVDEVLVTAGKITLQPEKELVLKGKSISVEPEDGVSVLGKSVEISPKQAVTIEGKSISLSPKQSVEITPNQGITLKSQQIKVDGTSVEVKAKLSGVVEAGGMLEVKGTMLKLN